VAKNVLYIVPSSGYGGAETFLLQTARFHDGSQVRPVYACFRDGPFVVRLRELGQRVYVAPFSVRLRSPLSWWRTTVWLCGLIRKEKAVLVHSTLAYGALFSWPSAKVMGVSQLWFQHGPVSGWQDWLAGKISSEAIIVNSAHTAEMQRAMAPRSPLKPLRLGVETISRSAGERAVSREEILSRLPPDTAFLVGVLCRPQPQKGIELFIEALALLRGSGIRAAGVCVGGTSPASTYEWSLRAAAEKKGVAVLWQPYLASPWSLLCGCDLFVSAAVAPEAYGLALAEAMSLGLPVLAPREGGPLDLIEEGETGLFFQPRDAVDLAEKIKFIANGGSYAAAMGLRAAAFACKELRAEQSVARLETIYREID
jgi:glycosyltransferase involved in cell wall biosynthesis